MYPATAKQGDSAAIASNTECPIGLGGLVILSAFIYLFVLWQTRRSWHASC